MNQLKRSAPIQSLMGFVPYLVLQNFINNGDKQITLPFRQKFTSVVMFADISGFTQITEDLSKVGPEGAEMIALVIIKYMELLQSIIGKSGGDIFKFSGLGAIIVIWPPPKQESDLSTLCRQAVQSALDIQQLLSETTILPKIKLSVKLGLGVGEISVIYVGGVFQRSEYLPAGDPLIQAFKSEYYCLYGGETVVSTQVQQLVKDCFNFQPLANNPSYYKLLINPSEQKHRISKSDSNLIHNNINPSNYQVITHHILPYIPAALLPYIDIDEEKWSTELRYLTIVFVRLGIGLREVNLDLGLQKIQNITQTLQKCVYMHEGIFFVVDLGSVNKLLMDENGSTMIVVFGLPPMGHEDDAVRALLMSFLFIEELQKSKVDCYMGVATGIVFTGVIGIAGFRREYSVFGDKVNLAARLMEQASLEQDRTKRVLCCQQTAQDASNKLKFIFYKSILLKGKKQNTAIFLPSKSVNQECWYDPFPEVKPHLHNYQLEWLKQQQENFMSKIEPKEEDKAMMWNVIGQSKEIKDISSTLDRFLRGKDKKGIYIISGTYGIGKTLTLKNILIKIQKKMNRGQYREWKYGEKNGILISQILPLEKNKIMNGLQPIFQQMFKVIAQRRNQQPDRQYFETLLKPEDYITKDYRTFQKILGLRRTNILKNFPPIPKKQDLEDLALTHRQFKAMTFDLLNLYFEKLPHKYEKQSSFNKEQQSFSIQIDSSPDWSPQRQDKDRSSFIQKQEIEMNNIIAPLILCFEDMQDYDYLTFYLLKSIMKNFDLVFMIGCVRDCNIQRPIIDYLATQQENTQNFYIEGIGMLRNSVEKQYYYSTVIKNLTHNNEVNEFDNLLQGMFGIREFRMMQQIQLRDDKTQTTQSDLKQKVQVQNINLILKDQLLFSINKWELMRLKFSLYMSQFLYLKTQGNPLVFMGLMINIIHNCLLSIDKSSGIAYVTSELRKIIEHEEMVTLQAPICSVQNDGPIIDKLNCLESLIMKVASVIGDIFDLQTLNKINPFKDAINYDTLSKILKELDRKNFIDIMDITENNIYYRFAAQNTREVIYQRMTYGQRRELHRNVAEAIHILPQLPGQDQRKEQLKLEFHWTQSENKNETQKSKLNENNLTMKSDLFSQKAKRSMVVKQILEIMSKSNNNPKAEIKMGILQKKSDSNITWAGRFCLLDQKSFIYYHSREDYQSSRDSYQGSIPLKHIYQIQAKDHSTDNKKNVFHLQVSSWLKKNKEMPKRGFSFSASNESEVERWTIFLEFTKAKAIYDDFVDNFGKIQFPIGSSLSQYDPNISVQVNSILNRTHILKRTSVRYQIPSQFSQIKESRASKFLAIIQRQGAQSSPEEQRDHRMTDLQTRDINLLEDRIKVFFYKGFLVFFAQICEMSLQETEKVYKNFGQTPKIVLKQNLLLRIDHGQMQLVKSKTWDPEQDGQVQPQGINTINKGAQAKIQSMNSMNLKGFSPNRSQNSLSSAQKKINLISIPEVDDNALEDHSLVRNQIIFNENQDEQNTQKTFEEVPIDYQSDQLSYSQFFVDLKLQIDQDIQKKNK